MARNYKQGVFRPLNPEKYVGDVHNIFYRSSWESKLMRWLDKNPSVEAWASEEVIVPYYSRADRRDRRYFVDFAAKVRQKDGSLKSFLIEVKPAAQCEPPKQTRGKNQARLMNECYDYMVNQDKWEAATKYAEKRGMQFIVLTEKELGIVR